MKTFKNILLWGWRLFYIFVLGSVLWVLLLKFLPVPVTPHQMIRLFKGWGMEKEWAGYDAISPNIFSAVIAAEDGRFFRHEGIDWRAMKAARRYNEAHPNKRRRGASTITMQTAKNTFLWHGRNYVRKGLEAYFTYLIEFIWGKKRILEVYVNVVEWGKGIYGVEAASQRYFGKSAANLTRREAALLAAVLPNPIRWSPAKPTPYILKRANWIMGRMGGIPKEYR